MVRDLPLAAAPVPDCVAVVVDGREVVGLARGGPAPPKTALAVRARAELLLEFLLEMKEENGKKMHHNLTMALVRLQERMRTD